MVTKKKFMTYKSTVLAFLKLNMYGMHVCKGLCVCASMGEYMCMQFCVCILVCMKSLTVDTHV